MRNLGKWRLPSARAAALILTTALSLLAVPGSWAQVTPVAIQTAVAGPWTAAQAAPIGTAVDASGNLYVAEYSGEAILELNAATGAVTTFATACGTRGLNHPGYMATDSSGNLYVSSPTDSAIFVFSTTSGNCNLQYGAGGASPLGLALDASGNLFYTTYLYKSGLAVGVYEVPAGSPTGTSGAAILSSGLNNAAGIAFDPVTGDMLVADRGAGTVFRYTKSSSYAASSETTFASGLSAPSGLAFDAQDNLYVALAGANTVQRYDFASGSASPVQLTPYVDDPEGLSVDAGGDIYLAAEAGNGVTAFSARLGAAPVGSASAVASVNFQVQAGTTIGGLRFLTQGAQNTEFTAPASDANPYLCSLGAFGSTTVCTVDLELTPAYAGVRSGALQVLDGNNALLATAYVQGTGTGPQVAFMPATETTVPLGSGLAGVQAVAEDGAGNLYLGGTDASGEPLIVREAAGGYAATVIASEAGGSQLIALHGVAIDGAGNVFVAGAVSGGNGAVLKEALSADGAYTESVAASDTGWSGSSAVQFAYGLAVDGHGDLFVAGADDSGEGIVAEESPIIGGGYTESIVAAETAGSALTLPKGIAVDAAGDLFVTNNAPGSPIYKEAPQETGGYTESALSVSGTTAVTHTFTDIAVDANGDLLVADTANNAVYEEAANAGIYAESRLATSTLSGPTGVALDGRANLSLVDAGHARVLEENYADPPSVTFTDVSAGTTSLGSAVYLANHGNAALDLPAPASGTNPVVTGPFVLSSGLAGDCPVVSAGAASASLAAGAGCALPISFAPTTTGNAAGTLTLTDTQSNASAPAYATQTAALSGSAMPGPTQLLLSDVTPSVAAGSGPGTIVASLLNASGGVVTGSTASVALTITGPGGFTETQTAAAAGGEAGFRFATGEPTVAGAYTITAASSGLPSATGSFTVTAAAAETTALSGLSPTAAAGGSLGTLTAAVVDAYGNTVTSASPKLTASVTAPGGTVSTVSAQAKNGIASFSLSGIALGATGSWSVTVAGSGLVSSGISVQVTTAAATPDFSLSVTAGSASSAGPLTIGQTATWSLTIAPTAGSYAQPITFTVTGLPADATASFSPASVTPGSAAAGVTLSVARGTGAARIQTLHSSGAGSVLCTTVLAALALPFAGRRRCRSLTGALTALAGLLLLAGALCGCSDGATAPPSAAAYTLTVTATSGSQSHTTALTLLEE